MKLIRAIIILQKKYIEKDTFSSHDFYYFIKLILLVSLTIPPPVSSWRLAQYSPSLLSISAELAHCYQAPDIMGGLEIGRVDPPINIEGMCNPKPCHYS